MTRVKIKTNADDFQIDLDVRSIKSLSMGERGGGRGGTRCAKHSKPFACAAQFLSICETVEQFLHVRIILSFNKSAMLRA